MTFVELPIDPDLDEGMGRPRWPRLRADIIAVVFAGGCLGGWARYAVTSAWPAAAGRFPWATFAVNTSGAFLLAIVVVAATDLAAPRYLRPVLGVGFCGAFTTFSSIVVTADQLFAHAHPRTAAVYVVASIGAGLTAAALGLICARSIVPDRRRRDAVSTSGPDT
jgi:CrcB protein